MAKSSTGRNLPGPAAPLVAAEVPMAPSSVPYARPAVISLEQVFGANPERDAGFLPGSFNAFSPDNPASSEMVFTQAHHQPGFEAPMPSWLKDYGPNEADMPWKKKPKPKPQPRDLADAVQRSSWEESYHDETS